MSIQKIFMTPEKQQAIKVLTRKTDEALAAVKDLVVMYKLAPEVFGNFQKVIVAAYKAEVLTLQSTTNDEADITYVAPTRNRSKKNAETPAPAAPASTSTATTATKTAKPEAPKKPRNTGGGNKNKNKSTDPGDTGKSNKDTNARADDMM